MDTMLLTLSWVLFGFTLALLIMMGVVIYMLRKAEKIRTKRNKDWQETKKQMTKEFKEELIR